MRLAVALWILVLSSACGGFTQAQRARTLGAGVHQRGGGVGYQFVAPTRHGLRAEAYSRHGIDDGKELQFRAGGNVSHCWTNCGEVGLFGSADVEAGMKLALTPQDGPFVVSIAPSLAVTFPFFAPFARVPVLVGHTYPDGNESVFSLTAATGGGNAIPGIAILSYAHVFKNGGVLVIPELAVGMNVFTPLEPFAQLGVSFLFGDSSHLSPSPSPDPAVARRF